jgi:hypothetical protein
VQLHGLIQVHVLQLHEPTRQAGADGHQRDIETTAVLRRLPRGKMPARIGEILAVARVAGKEPMQIIPQHGPRAPQRLVAIVERAARPVLRRRAVELHPGVHMVLPPVELHGIVDTEFFQPALQAQRR